MTYSKIEGKFYPLQNDEYVRACDELTPAQKDIFYYLKTIDPFGDHSMKIDVSEIARRLKLTKDTVYRSLKTLYRLGWLGIERIKIQLQVSNLEVKKDTSPLSNPYILGIEPYSLGIEPQSLGIEPQSQKPEALPNKGSSSSHTNKTNKTNKTLSLPEKEREKFLEFARRKAGELPKPPTLPEKWIDKNHDELWAKYQELEQRKETNDQQRMQSIDKQQETVVDPLIAAALENGEILEIDELYKMFRVQEGWWHWRELDEWRTKRSANQPTNEELLRDKQLIAKAANIPI